MYAIIESGGKQHRVEEGEVLRLEKLEVATGDSVKFDKVLLVSDGKAVKVGAPYVDGASVAAEVVEHGRGDKVKIIKFRRRKHSRTQQGHRQWFTDVKITAIGGSKPKAAKKAAAKPKKEAEPAAEAEQKED